MFESVECCFGFFGASDCFLAFEYIESVERVERVDTGVFGYIAFLKSKAFILKMCSEFWL